MKKRLVLAALALALSARPTQAAVITFDFESETATGAHPGGLTSLTMTVGGLTIGITRVGGVAFDIVDNTVSGQTGKPVSWGNRTLSPFFNFAGSAFIINFSLPVNFFLVDYGDYGGDSDTTGSIEGYAGANATGALLDSVGIFYGPSAFPTFLTGAITGLGMNSVRLIGGSTAFPHSIFWDNIVVDAVPEPTTLLLLGGGLLAASRRLRRRG